MIRHIVMWTFADGPDKAAIVEQARAGLAGLDALVPGQRALSVVVPTDPLQHTHDLLLVGEFDTAAALAAYLAHPDHVAVASFIATVRTDRACIDYEVPAR